MTYYFDGSFNGFLTCIFESFERKLPISALKLESDRQPGFFNEDIIVMTDVTKSQRVWKGIRSKIGSTKSQDVYKAFLSEDENMWLALVRILNKIFTQNVDFLDNFGDTDIVYWSQILKKVSRERHRMKAFIRFKKDNNGLYLAIVAPDFNVLPLIISFFKNRYSDQPWLIYDEKRKYGIHYDLSSINEVFLEEKRPMSSAQSELTLGLDEEDDRYQRLWKCYFKSTNIEARKNMKLHIQHVPKRYWRYLVEKQDELRGF